MALTFNTGMTPITAADSVTDWAATRFSGSGQAPSASLDTTVVKEGSGSVSAKLAGNNWNAALLFDYYTNNSNTTLDMTAAGNEVLAFWLLITTPSVMLAISSGGGYVIISSSADTGTTNPTAYSEWWVTGAATFPGGWVLVMVDTRKTPSTTTGGGASLSAVRRIGFGIRNISSVGNVKADNCFIDAMWYGRPIYQVIGDGSTVADMDAFISDSQTNVNGLIQDLGGAYHLSCGLRFGDGSQSNTTTFSDTSGKDLIFKRYTYHDGSTGIVDALNYADYYLLDALGAASQRTSVTFGTSVGTGDDRQGLLGGRIASADISNMTWSVDFQTDKADLSAVNLYGLSFIGAKGGILLDNNSGGTETELISCTFVNCGEIDPGTTGNGATLLSCNLIDPTGGGSGNNGLLFPNTTNRVKKLSCITSGSPSTQHMTHLNQSSDYTIAFDAVKFFGDFSSSTLWHGENSGNGADVVISALNQANPTASEFDNTGTPTGTVTVSNDVTLQVTVLDEAGDPVATAQTAIYTDPGGTELMNTDTDGSGVASTTYNYPGSDQDVVVRVRKGSPSATKYYPISSPQKIISTGLTTTITLIEDPNNAS